jgi:hypothetical protein
MISHGAKWLNVECSEGFIYFRIHSWENIRCYTSDFIVGKISGAHDAFGAHMHNLWTDMRFDLNVLK